jgi:SAM-dependent methyltransferase/tRNA A-37 threonylcarbamoyl transferase component Bud32
MTHRNLDLAASELLADAPIAPDLTPEDEDNVELGHTARQIRPDFDDPFADVAPLLWKPTVAIAPVVPRSVRPGFVELLATANLADCMRTAFVEQHFEHAVNALQKIYTPSLRPAVHLARAYFEMLLGHSDFARDELDRAAQSWNDDESQRYVDMLRLVNQCLCGRPRSPPPGAPNDSQDAEHLLDLMADWSAAPTRDWATSCLRMAAAQRFPNLSARLGHFAATVHAVLNELSSDAEFDSAAELQVAYVKHKFRTSTIVYRGIVGGISAAIKIIRCYNDYISPHEAGEAEILQRLGERRAPCCLWSKTYPDVVALVTSWVDGVPLARTKGYAIATADELRLKFPTRALWDAVLLRLRRRIAELSRLRVVHGDLGFDNILIDGDDIALIDFGLAVTTPSIADARIQNAAHVSSLDKTVTDLLGPSWAAINEATLNSHKETTMNAAATLPAIDTPESALDQSAWENSTGLVMCDLYGNHDPGRILTLAALRQALDELYAAEAQQFGLTKFYQSFELIGINSAFRSSEARLAFYGLTRFLHKSHNVLDIGCNTGFVSMMLAPFVRRIYGVDATKSLIQIARLTAHFLGHANCQYECVEFTRFETSEQFDVVLDLAAHGWINLTFEAFLAKVDRLLKPGGLFVIESHHLQNSADRAFDARVGRIAANGYALLDRRKVPETGDNSPREFCVFRKQAGQ